MTNNGLPPLPLIDGCLFIDNSSWVEGFSSCYRYLQYKSLNLRIPAAEKPSLNFGSAIHLALEYRYKVYGNKCVDDAYYNTVTAMLSEFFTAHPTPAEDWRTLNWCIEVLRQYNSKYDIEAFNLLLDKDGKPMVEMSFALPLFEWQASGPGDHFPQTVPIVYTGRIDLPVSLDGQIYVMDHKTTGMMGKQFFDEMRMTSQQRGYVWAFEQLMGQKVHGYIVNAIRTKEPPQYVMAGKPSTRGKSTSPAQWWSESLNRERFLIKPKELEEWKHNTIDLVEEFFWHYSRGYMPMKTKWCAMYGRCPYYEVCQLASEDRGIQLASGQFTDNTWSPLKQPTAPMQ